MRKRIKLGAIALLLVGVCVLLYPYFEQWKYGREAEEKFVIYTAQNKERKNLLELYRLMEAYNKKIFKEKQAGLKDPFAYEKPSFELEQWGLPNDIVAFLDIPKMDIKLPIYLGATEENLNQGAAHLSHTSVPIGGKNTNCVIAAHRGYYKANLFKEIEKLELEDEIYITNYWETLTYRVAEIKVIYPSEIEEIFIQKDRDLVTLMTCHPRYGGTFEKRYIVYCERV